MLEHLSKHVCIILACGAFFTNISFASDFSECKTDLKKQAQQRGYSDYIIDNVIEGLAPIKRVVELDKKQPEFSETFSEYVNKRVTPYRINVGREKLKHHQKLLAQLQKKYGVPAHYLVSFWGLETNYGTFKGKMPVLNSIATLACDPRRSDYFTNELFQLFTLIDTKVVTTDQLLGSWAGAMGHMQFMPSAFINYAVDGDGDGKIDIWNSEVDALTSAANYLSKIGWQNEERWGRLVLLPENFAFDKTQYDRYYPLDHFKQLQVKTASGHELSSYEIDAELFLPAGATGSAFLLYPNFNVIMKWNLSKNYALAVGLLAEKLQGVGELSKISTHQQHKYTRDNFKALQRHLNFIGYNLGEPDGIWGPKSRQAIRAFQLSHELTADGFPNPEVFKVAGIS